MFDAQQRLLAGIIDYAGTFPPAALPLDEAVAHLRRYRTEPEAWMLGRSVFPAAKLVDLVGLGWNAVDGKLSVLVPGAKTEDEFFVNLRAALEAIAAFPHAYLIDTLELLWPADVGTSFASLLRRLNLPKEWTAFFEFAAPDPSDEAFARQATAAAKALADANAGFKIRTGGAAPTAMPSEARLGTVIAACRDAKVFWKATGGLHHPWRLIAGGFTAHGFVNVAMAAALAESHGLDVKTLETILGDEDASHFRFTNESASWNGRSLTAAQIASARTTAFRSFGSCSFDEPRDDLKAIGWLP